MPETHSQPSAYKLESAEKGAKTPFFSRKIIKGLGYIAETAGLVGVALASIYEATHQRDIAHNLQVVKSTYEIAKQTRANHLAQTALSNMISQEQTNSDYWAIGGGISAVSAVYMGYKTITTIKPPEAAEPPDQITPDN